MSNSFPAIDVLQLSYSTRGAYRSCERKLEFYKFYKHSARSESLPGDAGNALHRSMYIYLTTGDLDKSVATLALEYPIQFQKSAFQYRSLEACYSTLLAAIDAASQQLLGYELAAIVHNGKELPAIEIPFQININNFTLPHKERSKGIPVTFVGFIDLIFYNSVTDTYIVVDIKTTRDNMQDYTPKFYWDDQCLPYGLVLERILKRPIVDFNIMYWVWYIDHLEPRAEIYPFMKTENHVQEWAQQLAVDLMSIRLYWDLGWFPRRGNACVAYNHVCSHYNYCESRDRKHIETMLEHTGEKDERPPFEPWFEVDFELQGL